MEKPRILKAIFTAILAFIVFGLVYLLTFLILGGIIYVLSIIPIIGGLVDLLFSIRGDSPDMLLATLSPTVAYITSKITIDKIGKTVSTTGLTCILVGIFILLVHIPSLIINIAYGEWFFPNITQALAGIVFMVKGIGSTKE